MFKRQAIASDDDDSLSLPQPCYWYRLPTDTIGIVYTFLTANGLSRMGRICKRIHPTSVWFRLAQRDFAAASCIDINLKLLWFRDKKWSSEIYNRVRLMMEQRLEAEDSIKMTQMVLTNGNKWHSDPVFKRYHPPLGWSIPLPSIRGTNYVWIKGPDPNQWDEERDHIILAPAYGFKPKNILTDISKWSVWNSLVYPVFRACQVAAGVFKVNPMRTDKSAAMWYQRGRFTANMAEEAMRRVPPGWLVSRYDSMKIELMKLQHSGLIKNAGHSYGSEMYELTKIAMEIPIYYEQTMIGIDGGVYAIFPRLTKPKWRAVPQAVWTHKIFSFLTVHETIQMELTCGRNKWYCEDHWKLLFERSGLPKVMSTLGYIKQDATWGTMVTASVKRTINGGAKGVFRRCMINEINELDYKREWQLELYGIYGVMKQDTGGTLCNDVTAIWNELNASSGYSRFCWVLDLVVNTSDQISGSVEQRTQRVYAAIDACHIYKINHRIGTVDDYDSDADEEKGINESQQLIEWEPALGHGNVKTIFITCQDIHGTFVDVLICFRDDTKWVTRRPYIGTGTFMDQSLSLRDCVVLKK
jgi:hypothetical protein